MPVGLSLDDGANGPAVPLTGLRRVLITPELSNSAALAKERVVFEIQSTDWRRHRDLSSAEMAAQLRQLYQLGVRHSGYYPDNLQRGTPDPSVLRTGGCRWGSSR